MKRIATGCSVHTANKQLKMTPTNERFAQLLYSSTAKIILIISFGIAIIIRLLFCVLPGLSLSRVFALVLCCLIIRSYRSCRKYFG